jgi:hypothetical protein
MVAIPVFVLLFFASIMSDCMPLIPCNKSILREAVVPSMIVALIISQCSYWTVRWKQRHGR